MNDVKNAMDRVHDMRPVDTRFVAGRWHPDRLTLRGLKVEAKVFLKSLVTSHNDNRRFLIIGRARSGTTLLTGLLNGHSNIHCDREIFHSYILRPKAHFKRLAAKSTSPVYGAKLLSYQMVQVHRMRTPDRFLSDLAEEGVDLIHLERGTFLQTLSLAIAGSRNLYHSEKGAGPLREKITLDPRQFRERIAWNEALLAFEKAALQNVPHQHILYERDLNLPETQQATLSTICANLGVNSEIVPIPLKKILPQDPREIIKNYADVARELQDAGYGHLLPAETR